MAFPQTPLPVAIALFLGGTWVDITPDVYLRNPIQITWGRQDWASTADTTKCPLTINNRHGKYSPKNPTSPYYGLLGRNTPVRVRVTTPTGLESTRFEGNVSSWPTRWDVSGKDVYVGVQANGIRRRLSQGVPAERDALRRHTERHVPLSYWPLTDGEDARHGSEIMQGSQPMRAVGEAGSFYQGQPSWGKGSLAPWLEPVVELPDETIGRITAYVPPRSVTGWSIDHTIAGSSAANQTALEIIDTGPRTDSAPQAEWRISTDAFFDEVQLRVTERGETTSSTALLADINAPGIFDGGAHHLRLTTAANGSDTDWAVYVDGVLKASGTRVTVHRPVNRLTLRWGTVEGGGVVTNALSLGHITYWGATAPVAADTWRAVKGYDRELAGRRIERLCAEQNVPLAVTGNLDHTPQMGPQRPGTFLDLLQTASDVDGGVLYESRAVSGLAFRTQRSKYNQGL